MDVDNDIDANLLQQFSSLGTNDKDVLIAEFQKLLGPGNQLSATGCAFFLDMNNWNLQAAVCSYYDYEQPSVKLPLMAFLRDVTIGEGESVPPNTRFIKTWRIQNTGNEDWPPGCCLKFDRGDHLSHQDRVMVEPLCPGQMTDVSVEMHSPATTGMYQGQWRMTTPTGMYFGEVIWVIVQVEESGLLGVTQQMSQFGAELSQCPTTVPLQNPFASPGKRQDSPTHSNILPSPSVSTEAHVGSLPDLSSAEGGLMIPSPFIDIQAQHSSAVPERLNFDSDPSHSASGTDCTEMS